jgi:hypothetical protein
VEPLLPLEVDPPVVELLPVVEVLPVVEEEVSADVDGVPELVLLVAVAPEAPESSSPPHAASANVAVPNSAIQTKRPEPFPCAALCMQPPKTVTFKRDRSIAGLGLG